MDECKTNRVTVVSLFSSGRSGSTVLATLLGRAAGVFYAGELQPLWGPSRLQDELCSCGQAVFACPVWGPIFNIFLGQDNIDRQISYLRTLRDHTSRARHILFEGWMIGKKERQRRKAQFLALTERFYHVISQTTGCPIIVDTSKWPSYSVLLGQIGSLDLRLVHLVRDPRAVAFSWTRSKAWKNARGAIVRRSPPLLSAWRWLVQNALIEAFRPRFSRYMLVKYEDFVADPVSTLADILRFVGSQAAAPQIIAERPASASPGHILGANPDRFNRMSLRVRADNEWRDRMRALDHAGVTLLTLPFLYKYGYLKSNTQRSC